MTAPLSSVPSAISPRTNEERERQRLIQRIRRAFEFEWRTKVLGDCTLPWIQVVDPDHLLEDALSRTDRSPDELDPFWAATWPAANGLEKYLRQFDLRDERVLELGCGSGHVGIAAASQGAWVTMTDGSAHALLVARCNAWPLRERVHVRRLNWRSETCPGRPYRWIVGSDLVYDPSLWEPLEGCARRHIAPGGRWILSEPQRHTGDQFRSFISDRGWRASITLVPVGSHCSDIRIFDLQPPEDVASK